MHQRSLFDFGRPRQVEHHGIDYDNAIKPQVALGDHDLVAHVAAELAKIMPALTTALSSPNSNV